MFSHNSFLLQVISHLQHQFTTSTFKGVSDTHEYLWVSLLASLGVQDCLTLHYVKGKYQSKTRTETSYVQRFCLGMHFSIYGISWYKEYQGGFNERTISARPFNHRPRSTTVLVPGHCRSSWRCRGPVGRLGCFLGFLKIDHSGRGARIV